MAAMTGSGRAKRGSSRPKPIKPVPQAPPPKPQTIQPIQTAQATPQQTQATQPSTSMSFPKDKDRKAMAQQSVGLADQRVAAYPQLRQQSAILPVRLR
jgi:hypothetical protein